MSWLWPIRVARVMGAHGTLELTWTNGRLMVDSEHANQSFGSLHRVWRKVLRATVLPDRLPATALMLGYGAGSAAHVLLNELGLKLTIVGVDDDATMLGIAREHFGAALSPGVQLLEQDAFVMVHGSTERFDLVLVDLFHDLDLPAEATSPSFFTALKARCSPGGTVCFNTVWHNEESASMGRQVEEGLRQHFHRVDVIVCERMNRVFIAR